MADKKPFSEILRADVPEQTTIPPNAKVCAHCMHARIEMNAQLLRKVVTCKALPKFPVAVTTPNGSGIRFFHPTMELHEECDLFEPQNRSTNGT